jgi:hypothetical protein
LAPELRATLFGFAACEELLHRPTSSPGKADFLHRMNDISQRHENSGGRLPNGVRLYFPYTHVACSVVVVVVDCAGGIKIGTHAPALQSPGPLPASHAVLSCASTLFGCDGEPSHDGITQPPSLSARLLDHRPRRRCPCHRRPASDSRLGPARARRKNRRHRCSTAVPNS